MTRSKKLSADPVARRGRRDRRLGRLAALVLLVGPGARERLHLVLDRQDTVADRKPVHRQRHQPARALAGDALEMIGFAADHAATRDIGVVTAPLARESDRSRSA